MPRDQNRARREVALVGWMDGNESLRSKFWAVGSGELFLSVSHLSVAAAAAAEQAQANSHLHGRLGGVAKV